MKKWEKIKKFLEKELTLSECIEIVKKRLSNRENLFLDCIRSSIFNNIKSPYLQLLKNAGYARFSDIEKLVNQNGLEQALYELKDKGVFLTYEEFKGYKRIIRGNLCLSCCPSDFRNPNTERLGFLKGGSTFSPGINLPYSLEYLTEKAIHEMILLGINECMDYPIILWYPDFPSPLGLYPIRLQKLGKIPIYWYSQVTPDKNVLRIIQNNLFRKYIGAKWPHSKYVTFENVRCIVETICKVLKEKGGCTIHAFVSGALRISEEAERLGLNIEGAIFIASGETLTAKKRFIIEKTGAKVIATYYCTEDGLIGFGCGNDDLGSDGVYICKDSFAVINYKRCIRNLHNEFDSLLITTLYDSPYILFNVENGDSGIIEDAKHGHKVTELGFDKTIRNIRSFEKITAEGMTYLKRDFVYILEEVFPVVFGGTPIDYQLVEDENTDGSTKLYLFVNPKVGKINAEQARKILLDSVDKERNTNTRIKILKMARTIDIKYTMPFTTPGGKVYPLFKK